MRVTGTSVRQACFAIWRALGKPFSELSYICKFILPPLVLSYYRGRQLDHILKRTLTRSKKSIVAIIPYYGNEALIPGFLQYYRRLGIGEFVFLDLSLQHRLAKLVAAETDCDVWRPRGTQSRGSAIHWLNFLRRRHGNGRWCLSVEPSEFLVFAHSETRDIRDLVDFLVAEQRNHLFALTLDMYGDREATAISFSARDDPLELLPYFDPVGYACHATGPLRSVPTHGGVQRRTVYCDAPKAAPALNRIPLVKWRWYFSYLAGTRLMAPGQLNTAHSRWHLNPTACLLRFALLDDEASLAVAERAEEAIIVADRTTPSYTGIFKMRNRKMEYPASVRFTGSQDLLDWGLLVPGQWF